jgi:alkylhydroperoxidase/carboxymuconolactone decarboxylase family protein YurZ
MSENTPVLDCLTDMTAISIAEGSLEAREHMLARMAALVAVGAPDASYLMNAAAASEVGVTVEDVQGVLVAIAPIVGTPRVLAGAGGITRALGFAVSPWRKRKSRRCSPRRKPSPTPRRADAPHPHGRACSPGGVARPWGVDTRRRSNGPGRSGCAVSGGVQRLGRRPGGAVSTCWRCQTPAT